MTPTLVLTRPEPQARALAEALGVAAIISPILEIVAGEAAPDLSAYRGVILTSANAIAFVPGLDGVTAHCVGERTAAAARAAGARIGVVARDADELVDALPGPGPLLHLRGDHARGAIAKRLSDAGTATDERVVYRQRARALTDAARAAIEGGGRVVLPLFSPRSARLVGEAVRRPGAGVHAIAMSPAVAEAWATATGGAAEVCASPTGEDMRRRIADALKG